MTWEDEWYLRGYYVEWNDTTRCYIGVALDRNTLLGERPPLRGILVARTVLEMNRLIPALKRPQAPPAIGEVRVSDGYWTSKAPVAPGWYWAIASGQRDRPAVVVHFSAAGVHLVGSGEVYSISNIEWWWFPPLVKPVVPPPTSWIVPAGDVEVGFDGYWCGPKEGFCGCHVHNREGAEYCFKYRVVLEVDELNGQVFRADACRKEFGG